jgi:hypothetical protein
MSAAHVPLVMHARKFLFFSDDAYTLFSLFYRHRARAGVARCGNPVSETPRSQVVSKEPDRLERRVMTPVQCRLGHRNKE